MLGLTKNRSERKRLKADYQKLMAEAHQLYLASEQGSRDKVSEALRVLKQLQHLGGHI